MNKNFFLLSLIYCLSINAFFYKYYRTEHDCSLVFLYDPREVLQNSDYRWHYFHSAVFEFPQLLEHAYKNNIPVFMACPADYDGISPIDEQAPFIEGSRVALAWISAYIRFKNLNGKVILLPEEITNDQICNLIGVAFQQNIVGSHQNPESKMLKSMIPANDLLTINSSGTHGALKKFERMGSDSAECTIVPHFNHENSNKRILITGGAGFLGSHLTQKLLDLNYQVIVLDSLLCSKKDNIEKFLNHENFNFFQVDVTKPYTIVGPLDMVIHLASVPSPEYYYRLPLETLATGLFGTKYALDVAREKKARFIFSSTSEVYGDPLENPQSEEYVGNVNPWGKRSQYDQSKRGAETLCKWYFEKFNIDIRIARIFNTYGPGMQLADGRVVTNFIEAALSHKPLKIYGDGTQTRSFGYVSDTIAGLMLLINDEGITHYKTIDERIFNIGNDIENTVNTIAKRINALSEKFLQHTCKIQHVEQIDCTDPKVRRPDLKRIAKLGYKPMVSLDNGLEKTFLYFMENSLFPRY